jgi:hypothetical protein
MEQSLRSPPQIVGAFDNIKLVIVYSLLIIGMGLLVLTHHRIKSGTCFLREHAGMKQYCVIKDIEENQFYNVECAYENKIENTIFFGDRLRFYELDFKTNEYKCEWR